VFDFQPARRIGNGYKRKVEFDKKDWKKAIKKIAAEESLFVSDVFRG